MGCGKCIECTKQYARSWQIRLTEELKDNKHAKFVTLTFSQEALSELTEAVKVKLIDKKGILENEIATIATRRFLERWRRKYGKSIKHWLVTELGHQGTQRIHMHGVIFTDKTNEEIEERWNYGKIWVGEYVNEKTINYIIKYVSKMDMVNKGYKPKILCSAGIGKGYLDRYDSRLNKYKGEKTKNTYTFRNGREANLPMYYRNKIYSDEQREQLWMNMLDEETRYVMGEKVDISKGEEEFDELQKIYRIKNKRLGYGDDSKEWRVEEYIKKKSKT